LYFISNLPCTQQAWKAKNKDQLLHCNEAIAEELVQQFNIIEFDYYSSDKIRFLQVIEETSDDHHNQKQTLKRSFNTGEFSAGLLLSQDGDIELNAVHPWVIDDSIVGYIELTSTVTHLLEQLTVTYPLDVLLLLAKENLNNDAWVQRRDGLGEEWDWDQFNLVVVSYGDNILASGNFMDHLKSGLDQKPLHYIKTIVDGTPYTLGMVPLLGESGTTIGNIVLLLDVSSSDEKMNSALFIYIFALVFSGLILLWLFDSKLGRVEIKVAQWGKDLEHEIVERQYAEKELQKFFSAVEHTGSAIVITDKQGSIEYINPSYSNMTGFKKGEEIGSKLRELFSKDIPDDIKKNIWQKISSKKHWRGELEVTNKDGKTLWIRVSISPVLDEKTGKVSNIISVSEDVTERRNDQAKIEHMAFNDTLTNLPNRRLFMERLRITLEMTLRSKGNAALLFIDLDGFKNVNDTIGHDAGDELLKIVAKRLSEPRRESDTIARIGGDEFTVILWNLSSVDDAFKVAESINQVLNKPFLIQGHEVIISSSIGIAIIPQDGEDVETVLNNADQAMYCAKRDGKNTYRRHGVDCNS
jgi:diguanylate cyclase (GGDEF)-like protein/PAS domain S-box-containing protein